MRSNYHERRSIKERYLSKMRMHVGNTCIDENGVAAGGWIMMRLSVVIVFGN